MTSHHFFHAVKRGVTSFGETISVIVASVLLLVVYVVGVGVTSIVAKVFGKHFLDTRVSEEKKTYWVDISSKSDSLDECYRQF